MSREERRERSDRCRGYEVVVQPVVVYSAEAAYVRSEVKEWGGGVGDGARTVGRMRVEAMAPPFPAGSGVH